eukprot:962427-Pelagomonas_calceolata.AAC.1
MRSVERKFQGEIHVSGVWVAMELVFAKQQTIPWSGLLSGFTDFKYLRDRVRVCAGAAELKH